MASAPFEPAGPDPPEVADARAARIGARRSGVIAAHPRRYAGRPGYVSTSARQALRLGHSDAFPRAGDTDPRHAGAPSALGRQKVSGGDVVSSARGRAGQGYAWQVVDDNLPLVTAQATLATAESNLVESLYEYNVSKLVLARAAGVLEQQYRDYLGR